MSSQSFDPSERTSAHDSTPDAGSDSEQPDETAESSPGTTEPESGQAQETEADDTAPDEQARAATGSGAESRAEPVGATPDAPAKPPITMKTGLKLSLTVALISGILEWIFARQITIGLIAFLIAFVALFLGFGAMMLVERGIDRRGEDDEQFPRL
ncbi:hypothetical protein [Spelaeicoccus albus]|uniref:Uncharacterized protein n=1 Tax=Spelaeicoccus albus TaxID=1280376 RepID=A0A7Z0ABB9_9MICO|nr:hypothetical protein [Spelaeicoccus albus]NYI66523.1 hypothetical protein [Spelaeicoccus albus]